MNSEVNKIKVDTRGDLFFRLFEINSEEQHAIFAHELQSALRMTAGFSGIHCEYIGHSCMTNWSVKS